MLVNRKDYNDSIAALAAASATHKKLRAEYVTDIRQLGTKLRKKFCGKNSGCEWIHITHEVNPANTAGYYGVDVALEGQHQPIIDAIIELMREEGWEGIRIQNSTTYCTHIRAY